MASRLFGAAYGFNAAANSGSGALSASSIAFCSKKLEAAAANQNTVALIMQFAPVPRLQDSGQTTLVPSLRRELSLHI